MEVLHLVNGVYQLAGRWRPGEEAVSQILPGLKVPVADLFAQD